MSKLSIPTISRLPIYLHYLIKSGGALGEYISATEIAKAVGFGDVSVRKDLAAVSGTGKPRIGYSVAELIDRLETVLGYNQKNAAVIVGAGKLGKALLEYEGFKEYGLHIDAAFDIDLSKVSTLQNGKEILTMNELESYCKNNSVKIGIITVPQSFAQEVCNTMTDCGISAIWNFAPVKLKTPEDIIIHNEDMALSLAILSGHLVNTDKNI